MSKRIRHLAVVLGTILLVSVLYAVQRQLADSTPASDDCVSVGRAAQIDPDFSDAVVPPNIAPLNFSIQEPGLGYFIRIHGAQGRPIEVSSRSGKMLIPEGRWHSLLAANRGGQIHVDVYVRRNEAGADDKSNRGQWRQFDRFTARIAREEIDRYLVYRKIHPAYSAWREMGIYQRDLTRFDESLILNNRYLAGGCLNCHTFCNNSPDTMLVSTRSGKYTSAAVLIHGDRAEKVGSKFGYAAWHPSGKMVTYAVNNVTLFFHSAEREVRDVIDLDSLLAYYLVDEGEIRTAPALAQKHRLETYPTWSPDGRYLYFCSAPLSWEERNAIPACYDEIRYDLMRVEYDVATDRWGTLEPVLGAEDTGKSILLPRISPDGRWLIVSMCDYGCFPVYQRSSDLYMIDLQAARETARADYRHLAINSAESESWHSWSSNSRWIAFSSKRGNGVFTRCYLGYVDEDGRTHKPILLPQKDPAHYDSCPWTYSVPELIVSPVRVTKEKLGRVVRDRSVAPLTMPITMATPQADVSTEHTEAYPIQ